MPGQTQAEIDAEIEALSTEIAAHEAEVRRAAEEEQRYAEEDAKKSARLSEHGGNSSKKSETKSEVIKGNNGGHYESEDRAAVEIQERLRFPYPPYSTVAFGKKRLVEGN